MLGLFNYYFKYTNKYYHALLVAESPLRLEPSILHRSDKWPAGADHVLLETWQAFSLGCNVSRLVQPLSCRWICHSSRDEKNDQVGSWAFLHSGWHNDIGVFGPKPMAFIGANLVTGLVRELVKLKSLAYLKLQLSVAVQRSNSVLGPIGGLFFCGIII